MLHQLASLGKGKLLTLDANWLQYAKTWPVEKQQLLLDKIDSLLVTLSIDSTLQLSVLALQRLLLGTSPNPEEDQACFLQLIQSSDVALTLPSKQAIEQQLLEFLQALEEEKCIGSSDQSQLTHYCRITCQLPQSTGLPPQVAATLGLIFKRTVDRLATPLQWSQLPQQELEHLGQQVMEDCELLRAAASPGTIRLLDKALHRWLVSYCRLFVPLPAPAALPRILYSAALYEQVLNCCGNTEQQKQIAHLTDLRSQETLNALNQACIVILQKVNACSEAELNGVVAEGIFLHGMSRTLQRLTSTLSVPTFGFPHKIEKVLADKAASLPNEKFSVT